jgi:hypothetical protein
LVAVTGTDVTALNTRARAERVRAGQVEPEGVLLRDDTRAGVGDWVTTRVNLRTLTCHRGRDWVKNGDTWQVTTRHPDGSLTVRHLDHHGTVRLPADYVATSVELGYAATAHRAQGTTVDTAHALVTPETTREALYVSSTRARECATWYTATDELLDPTDDRHPAPPATATEVLTAVLARSGAKLAATTTIAQTQDEVTRLPSLVARYTHTWEAAAVAMLRATASTAVGPALSGRLLADPAHRRLATVLARAAGQGADPGGVLADAVAFDDLTSARSPALVLASRIEDFPTALGIPRHDRAGPANRPLPWLDSPEVGHPGWAGYLRQRAALITHRLEELGSLEAAYREQYRLTHLPAGDLGDSPPRDTRRHTAYQAAKDEQLRREHPPSRGRPVSPSGPRPDSSAVRSSRVHQPPPHPVRRPPTDGLSTRRDP